MNIQSEIDSKILEFLEYNEDYIKDIMELEDLEEYNKLTSDKDKAEFLMDLAGDGEMTQSEDVAYKLGYIDALLSIKNNTL